MTKLQTIGFIVLFLLQAGFLNAQGLISPKPEKNVPVIVEARFSEKFPRHEPVWFSQYHGRYDNRLVYEGRFIFDNRYSSAVYDRGGNMIAFAATIEKNEIPLKARNYMAENFPTFPIADAMLVTRGMDEVTYEIGIYIDNQLVVQVFSKDGNFIKSTKG